MMKGGKALTYKAVLRVHFLCLLFLQRARDVWSHL